MERRERERILGQWGGRRAGEDPRDGARARTLAEDLRGSPLAGRPLHRRLRNFRPALDGYVASLGGPLPYMRRLRTIAEETVSHQQRLEEAWRALALACAGDGSAFARRWVAVAERWAFEDVNELIARHNEYYPAESRLPMDPRTGDFALVNGEPYRLEPLDATWVLERFPASLERVAA